MVYIKRNQAKKKKDRIFFFFIFGKIILKVQDLQLLKFKINRDDEQNEILVHMSRLVIEKISKSIDKMNHETLTWELIDGDRENLIYESKRIKRGIYHLTAVVGADHLIGRRLDGGEGDGVIVEHETTVGDGALAVGDGSRPPLPRRRSS